MDTQPSTRGSHENTAHVRWIVSKKRTSLLRSQQYPRVKADAHAGSGLGCPQQMLWAASPRPACTMPRSTPVALSLDQAFLLLRCTVPVCESIQLMRLTSSWDPHVHAHVPTLTFHWAPPYCSGMDHVDCDLHSAYGSCHIQKSSRFPVDSQHRSSAHHNLETNFVDAAICLPEYILKGPD